MTKCNGMYMYINKSVNNDSKKLTPPPPPKKKHTATLSVS